MMNAVKQFLERKRDQRVLSIFMIICIPVKAAADCAPFVVLGALANGVSLASAAMAATFASVGLGLVVGAVVAALISVMDPKSEDVYTEMAYGALYGGVAAGLAGAIAAVNYVL